MPPSQKPPNSQTFFRFLSLAPLMKKTIDAIVDILYGRYSKADIDATLATAQLTSSLCNNKCTATLDAGIFIFIKLKKEDGEYHIYHKRMTVRDRLILEREPDLIEKPDDLFKRLSGSLIALEIEQANILRKIASKEGI